MGSVRLHLRDVAQWQRGTGSYVRGYAFDSSTLGASSMLDALASVRSGEEFVQTVRAMNGFYAIIQEVGQEWYLAVDRIRSFPLFYAIHEGCVYISDDPYWIRAETDLNETADLARAEFLCTGYVTGSDTLVRGIRQVEAGQVLRISSVGSPQVDQLYTYRYTHQVLPVSLEEATEGYRKVLARVFRRLLARVGDRTIVVPLSGGYDSRLIVLMLKLLGHKRIVTYSYGRPGNAEATISKEVARNLQIPWLFVPYNCDQWFHWIRSSAWTDYQTYADGLVSLQHVQDWLAVQELTLRKWIPSDSIFVPGHSADLLAGSRSRALPEVYNSGPVDETGLVEAILAYHYCLNDWSIKRDELYPQFRDKVLASLGSLNHFPSNASGFECWDTRERQAKFIVNSVRVYEYWGYQWWLPFWDTEYMDFWSSVPLEHRVGAMLHERYIAALYSQSSGLTLKTAARNERQGMLSVIRNVTKRTPIYQYLRMMRRSVKRMSEYDSNPLAWYGIMTKAQFRRLYTGREHVNSFLTRIRMGTLRLD